MAIEQEKETAHRKRATVKACCLRLHRFSALLWHLGLALNFLSAGRAGREEIRDRLYNRAEKVQRFPSRTLPPLRPKKPPTKWTVLEDGCC